MTIVARFWV